VFHSQRQAQEDVDMAEALPQVFEVLGRAVRVPVQVERASAFSATYLASGAHVQRWIAASGLSVLEPVPGRTVLSIAALRYQEGDWGQYTELCIAVPVLAPDASRAGLWPALAALRNDAWGLYLHYLPVSEEFSARAGVQLYGFPKWVADIDITHTRRRASCTLASDGQHVLSLTARVPNGSSRRFAATSVDAYSFRDGRLQRCRFTVEGEGVDVRPFGAELELGQHVIASELSGLGLSRHALCVSRIERMRASFGPPEIVR
jgi:hypothetical protein